MRWRLLALMAGAQRCSASVDWQRQNRQPLPGAVKFVDTRTEEIVLHYMNATRRIFLVSAAAVLLGVHTHAQMLSRAMVQKATDVGTNDSAHELKCSGTVTDAAGHPLAGATVEYWSYEGNSFMAHAPTARKQII